MSRTRHGLVVSQFGISNMGKFDNRTRQLVLEDSAHGLSVAQICRKYGIKARSTVFLWRREARAVPPETISLRELQKMKAELAALRTENEILRRAGCSERSPMPSDAENTLPLP